jgi:uncharacterized RDD family membrane protein YckC
MNLPPIENPNTTAPAEQDEHSIALNTADKPLSPYMTGKETRKIVTPYAFTVSPDLLGEPLATPSRRGIAILIDLLLISLLSTVNTLVFAAVVALTFFRASHQMGNKNNHTQENAELKGLWRGTKATLKIAGALIIFVVVYSLIQTMNNEASDYGEATINELVSDLPADLVGDSSNEQVQDTITPDAESTGSESAQSFSVLEWIKDVMSDFGLGLGWAALYFSVLTAWWNGQTVGKRLLGIKVVRLDGGTPTLWESFGRYGGYGAGFATGLSGFFQVYWDRNRQAIQDKISETLVLRVKR